MTLENLALIIESVTGADPLRLTRKRAVVDARTLLVHAYRVQGRTEQQIADDIGYSRAAVHHYCALFSDAEEYNNNPALLRNWSRLKSVLDL